jgi:putative CocE/NonD family hydrolase
MTVDYDVPVRLRDGVVTYADVYRPGGRGRYPVLLTRTPYDKSGANGFPTPLNGVKSGYVVVIQDVRGRYRSEGRFDPLFQEFDDGYDSVEWCASQAWSNGRVGMHGGSYVGATQWLAAASDPPHLEAIAPLLTPSNFYAEWMYRGGAFQQQFIEHWLISHSKESESRSPWPTKGRKGGPVEDIDKVYESAYRFLPTRDLPLSWGSDYLKEWTSHPSQDRYWERINIGRFHSRIRVPALVVGGWYDFFLQGSLDNYVGMKAKGKTKRGRSPRLIVGPWNHGIPSEFSFGEKAEWSALGMDGVITRWFDNWMKGSGDKPEDEPPVRIFVMGDDVWRDEAEWPLSRARPTRFFLHSRGDANSSRGYGTLSMARPKVDEEPDRFVYDPLNPVPTIGEDLVGRSTYPAEGPHDQSRTEARTDVLVYSTSPLESDVEVTGRITMRLFASTSAADTDFTAKLVDVRPSGFAQLIADGIVRARYRRSRSRPEPLKPGADPEYELDLWSTSNVFKRGHRIRVDISSSNFPKFDRNLNSGKPVAEEAEAIVAVQSVFHDARRPSHLILPVVPRD